MNVRSAKIFLHISNVIISLMAAAAILCYFILPLWKIDISFTLTPDLVNELIPYSTANKDDERDTRAFVSDTSKKYAYADSARKISSITDSLTFKEIVKAIAEKNISISLTANIKTGDCIGSIFDHSTKTLEKAADSAVDQLAANSESAVSDIIDALVEATPDILEALVNDIINEFTDIGTVDDALADSGIDEERLDGIFDRIRTLITDNDVTVASATDTIMSSIDDILDMMSESEKYSDEIAGMTDEDKAKIRDSISEALSEYADENGQIQLQGTLLEEIFSLTTDALSDSPDAEWRSNEGQAYKIQKGFSKAACTAKGPQGGKAYTDTVTKSSERPAFYSEIIEEVKSQLRETIAENADSGAVRGIIAFMALIGVLTIAVLLMLAYPIIRSLTKIRSKNPGFHLALPIIAGIIPFIAMVLIPYALIGVLRSGILSYFDIPKAVLLDAVNIKIFSCTLIAFAVAAVLFVFSFFYGHYRRKLKKALKAAPSAYLTSDAISEAPAALPETQISETTGGTDTGESSL